MARLPTSSGERIRVVDTTFPVRPLTRGSVHIRSSNISESPEIDPQYLSNSYDLQTLVEAGKFGRKIAQTEPLASLLVSEYTPGLSAVKTDDEWAGYAREAMRTIFHYSGTCAMLPKNDGGVVDPRLKVWGTTNLRVVDASIVRMSLPLLPCFWYQQNTSQLLVDVAQIPVLVASHTQTVTYGIAERAADIIIADHQGS